VSQALQLRKHQPSPHSMQSKTYHTMVSPVSPAYWNGGKLFVRAILIRWLSLLLFCGGHIIHHDVVVVRINIGALSGFSLLLYGHIMSLFVSEFVLCIHQNQNHDETKGGGHHELNAIRNGFAPNANLGYRNSSIKCLAQHDVCFRRCLQYTWKALFLHKKDQV
jgi:hypothetical protein